MTGPTPAERAARMLPCFCQADALAALGHGRRCPAGYRDAVAAALEAQRAEIETLLNLLSRAAPLILVSDAPEEICTPLYREIHDAMKQAIAARRAREGQ